LEEEWDIRVLSGVELTHVPPRKDRSPCKESKRTGCRNMWLCTGKLRQSRLRPVQMQLQLPVNMWIFLLTPGLISEEDIETVKENNICLEITARNGHNRTNGHLARLASKSVQRLW